MPTQKGSGLEGREGGADRFLIKCAEWRRKGKTFRSQSANLGRAAALFIGRFFREALEKSQPFCSTLWTRPATSFINFSQIV
jgi:hypothetical protein